VACGEKLSVTQDDISIRGHAIECRILAEDPANNFAPSAGVIKNLVLPGGPGVRVDTHIYDGYEVPPYYDAMICKIIVHGKDREEAIIRMKRALSETNIDGIKTNIKYQYKILENPYFEKGDITTSFILDKMNND